MNTLKLILQYLLGIFFLIISLVYLVMGGTSIIGGLISIVAAMIVLPFSREIINQKLNLKFNKVIKYSTVFIGYFVPLFFVNTDHLKNVKTSEQAETLVNAKTLNTDSIRNDTLKRFAKNENHDKTPVAFANMNNGAIRKNISKDKNVSGKRQTTYSTNAKTAYKTKKHKKSSHVSSSSSYQYSSGYCGHPNKSGGNCRRRVKGGGYCWQHS